MSSYVLTSEPALSGFDRVFNETRLWAVRKLAVVSIAIPQNGETQLTKALEATYGLSLPPVGRSAKPSGAETRILRLGRDQLFLLSQRAATDALDDIGSHIKNAAYLTDQTDVWAALSLKGPLTLKTLERLCALDLSSDAFPVDEVARTMFGQFAVVLVRLDQDEFLVLTSSSSARSFLDTIVSTIESLG